MSDQRPLRPDPTVLVHSSASIREPGAAPRGPRPAARDSAPHTPWAAGSAAAPRPAARAPEPRRRPDPNPLRLMLGVAGLASAAALTSALLPSIAPQADATAADTVTIDAAALAPAVLAPEPSVRHVTRFVTLKPGQTAPPQATVVVRPKPTPVVTVRTVTKTRQSGKP